MLALFIGYDIYFLIKNRRKRDVIQQVIIWVLIQILLIAVWVFPHLLFKYTGFAWIRDGIRWAIVIGAFTGIGYIYGNEYGERRWLYSAVGHIGAVLLGWLINRWTGIFLLSFPIIATYYSALYILAMVVLPVSNPEDKDERWKRFLILASYAWGFQFPIRVVSGHAWKEVETRINGDFTRDFPVPGLIWTKSHHVVGITGGTQFNRVDGPGVIFTGKLEQPFQIVDLRLQLRTNEIEAVSKDGISFIVRVFTAFRMDPEPWGKDLYDQLRRMNPLLRGADKPSYTTGSFHFSDRRIQAALGTTSAKTSEPGKTMTWDRWVLNIVDEVTRKVVSQKTLDEFWRPMDDIKEANAMSVIAQEIKDGASTILRSRGILLLASRVVNFRFPPNGQNKMDDISKRQIAAWGSEWERKRAQKLADAEADAERDQQEARAYAESQLLNSIAEALQKTHEISPKLHKHVIAMRYLSALQDYAHKNTPEEEEKIKELHNSMRDQ